MLLASLSFKTIGLKNPVLCYVARLSMMASLTWDQFIEQMEWAFAFVPGGTFLISKFVQRSTVSTISQDILALLESIFLGYLAFAVLQTTRPTTVGPDVKSEFVQSTPDVVLYMIAIGLQVMKTFLRGPTLWDLFALVTYLFVALQTQTTTSQLTISWLLVSVAVWNSQSLFFDIVANRNVSKLTAF